MNVRVLTMRSLLEEILRRQEYSMEGLRCAFAPGEAVGAEFIFLLHRAVREGLVTGVCFVYGDNGQPFEAVWTDAKVTSAGRRFLLQQSMGIHH